MAAQWIVCATVLASLVAAAPASAATPKQVRQGRAFAIEACSACHLVREGQKPPPPVFDANNQLSIPAPSFMDIARAHGSDPAYLRKIITAPHWPMREQQFDKYYLDAIIVYIQSLRPKSEPKR